MNKKGKTVLLAEDGTEVIKRFYDVLSDSQFSVEKVSSLSLLLENGIGNADLVIMPYKPGAEDIAGGMDSAFIFVITENNPAEILLNSNVCALLDDSASDAVIIHTVGRALDRIGEGKSLTAAATDDTYRNLIDGMNESVWVIDMDGKILNVNRKALDMLGYSREELVAIGLPGIDPNMSSQEVAKRIIKVRKDNIEVFETVHKTRQGKIIPMEISSSTISYYGKNVILSIGRDISERKEAEIELREQLQKDELVIKAMHHRIKNNLATVSSLLSLQAKLSHSDEVQQILREAVGRIQCIALLYNKLLETSGYEGISVETYFSGIIDSLLDIYPEKKSLIVELDMGDIVLNEKYLFPLGVIIEELFTNIFKYGFPEGRGGRIEFVGKHEKQDVVLTLRDNGKPFPPDISSSGKGFGMMIVDLLCKQVKGSFSYYDDEGPVREIRFPLVEQTPT